jgi:hypothetical protein
MTIAYNIACCSEEVKEQVRSKPLLCPRLKAGHNSEPQYDKPKIPTDADEERGHLSSPKNGHVEQIKDKLIAKQ